MVLNSDGEEVALTFTYDPRVGSLNEELAAQYKKAQLLQRQQEEA